MGLSLEAIVKNVKGGVLIFFSSYGVMKRMNEIWSRSGTVYSMTETKKLFLEGDNAVDNQKVMENFRSTILKS